VTRALYIIEHIVSTHASDVPAEEISPDDDLIALGVLDSLSLVRLVSWLGTEYRIDVNNIDIHPDDFRTVQRIYDFTEQHLRPPVET